MRIPTIVQYTVNSQKTPITHVKFNRELLRLRLKQKDGKAFEFHNVPEQTFREQLSHGATIGEHIIFDFCGTFPANEIETETFDNEW